LEPAGSRQQQGPACRQRLGPVQGSKQLELVLAQGKQLLELVLGSKPVLAQDSKLAQAQDSKPAQGSKQELDSILPCGIFEESTDACSSGQSLRQ